ncbi:MAG TPA: TPM domain-containing protein [Pyrinomonadaceae bacterium]|nr:TPM domain-containing protein [Pyrinomonadaceae bacterium]
MKTSQHNSRAAIFSLILAVVSITHVLTVGLAQDKLPQPSGHINDFAEAVDPAGKQRLETILENLKQRTDLDLVVAIVKTVGTEDMYDYSLRVAGEWNVGARMSTRKSLLVIIAADNGHFFTQFSRAAQAALPDGLIGEMGRQMRPNFEKGDYNGGLLAAVQTFATAVGEQHNFTFAQLDPQSGELSVAQSRPRTVGKPLAPADTPTPGPIEIPSPEMTPSPTPIEAAPAQPTETPTPEVSPSATPSETATPSATETPTPSPSATESPMPETPTPTPEPSPTAEPTETPATPGATATPSATETPAGPTAVAKNLPTKPARATRSPSASPANPEDEKEEVEITLTKPADERIELLKAFIAAHPKSAAVPRANELIVAARATLGDQKLQAGDVAGGLEQFRRALSEAPTDMTDRLFTEVIARIPMNLFLRGQRGPAIEAAHQAEGLAKLNPVRLLALAQFYLGIEDATEANRVAELTVQTAPDLAAAHQVVGAARHIALRLEDAEAEYARALVLNPKSTSAKLALADLKRAADKNEAALALYREVAEADPKNNSARAGIILSLLELGRKDEAEQELNSTLSDPEKARNLPLLVGAAYWFMAHDGATRGLELAQQATSIEPRYSWAQIAFARALVADKRPLDAERALRFARQFGRFPTLDYELASVLAAVGLYDEAVAELVKSFRLKDGQLETKLAGRITARAATFTELLAPERRAAIFQSKTADTEANAKMLKALLAFNSALNPPNGRSLNEDDLLASAQDFTAGDDAMRTYRQIYVGSQLLRKGVALSTVVDLMDSATAGVEAALNVPAVTVAVQAEELSDARARALAQGGTPDVPNAPRAALSGLLRARIEELAGRALFNLDKPVDAVARLRRAVSVSPEGTPLWRSAMWHLGAALEANGKNDQALLYYIKSYLAGPPDPARRSVIENVYKKVNGTLDGLDEKIGPAFLPAKPTSTPR